MNSKESRKILYFFTGGTAILLLLIVLAPFIKSSEIYLLTNFSDYIYFFFKPVCHQMSERSILLNNVSLAVCIRCFAIYLGVFFYLLLLIFQNKIQNINSGWLILISLSTALDFLLEKFGLYVDIPIVRFITGFMFGIAIIYLILYSLFDIKNKNLKKQEISYGESEVI